MPAAGHAVAGHAHEVRGLVGAVAQVAARLDVVAAPGRHSLHDAIAYVLSILRIVLRLLAVDQCHPVDVVVLVVGVLVTPHYQLLFSFLQTDWSKRLGTLTRDINVGHVLIGASSGLRRDVVLALRAGQAHGVTQLARRADRWQHRLRQVVQPGRVVQVHVFVVLNVPIVFVHWWLSPLYAILVIGLTVVAGTVSQVPRLVIVLIVVIV